MTEFLDRILGFASDAPFADAVHHHSHHDQVEYVDIAPDEVARRRFRLETDKGTDCAISLVRDAQLSDGAILKLCDNGVIVVRLRKRQWLSLRASDTPAALEIGYFAGNLHWKVRFADGMIHVALEGPLQGYLNRLEVLIAEGKVEVISPDG